MIEYTIEKTLAEISKTGSTAKRLTLTSWNGKPAKIDLRVWRTDENGSQQPGKGITLTETEAAKVADAINEYRAQGASIDESAIAAAVNAYLGGGAKNGSSDPD